MQLNDMQQLINGRWSKPAPLRPVQLADPNSGESIGTLSCSSEADVEAAIASADLAFDAGVWSDLTHQQRADYLEKVANNLDGVAKDIARLDAQQTGVVINLTSQVANICGAAFRAAATHIRQLSAPDKFPGEFAEVEIQRLPLGPAAVIAPWNAPSGIACHKIASALAAGCTVVFKPSEWASGSAQLIADAIQRAELPEGTFQMVIGDAEVGKQLVESEYIAAVSFTGGAAGGAAVGQSCGRQIKPVQLELGGNNPMIVLADADLDITADSIVAGMITMNAQWCRALGRILVDERVSDALLGKVTERLANIHMGHSESVDSQMGCMVHKGHYQHIITALEWYSQLGADLIQVTPMPSLAGYFIPPTIVMGLSEKDTLEETFGPVACWHTFDDEHQAISLANQTHYGLAAYVFGEQQHALEIAQSIRSGMVKINRVTLFNLHPMAPRPAWGKSGLGDEGVTETFEFFRGTRVIGVAG